MINLHAGNAEYYLRHPSGDPTLDTQRAAVEAQLAVASELRLLNQNLYLLTGDLSDAVRSRVTAELRQRLDL